MAEVSFSIQMDENLKKQFEQVCSDLGMSVSMAIILACIKCKSRGRNNIPKISGSYIWEFAEHEDHKRKQNQDSRRCL